MSPRPLTSPKRPQSALPASVAAAIARAQANQEEGLGLAATSPGGAASGARPASAARNVGFLVHSLAAEEAVADRKRDRAEAEVVEELRLQWLRSAEGSVPKLPAHSPSARSGPSRRSLHIKAVVPRPGGDAGEDFREGGRGGSRGRGGPGAEGAGEGGEDEDLAGVYYEDNDDLTAAETLMFFSGGQEELAERLAARLDAAEQEEQNPYVLRLKDASGSAPPPRPQSAAPLSFRAVDASAFGPTVEYSKNVREMQPRPYSARPTSRPWTAGSSRGPEPKPRPTTASTVSFSFDGPRLDSKTFLRANWLDAYSDKLLAAVGASPSRRPSTATSSRRPASGAKVDSWSATHDVRRMGRVAREEEMLSSRSQPRPAAVGFPMPARPLSARGVAPVVPASQPPDAASTSVGVSSAPASVVSPGIARLNAWREKIGTSGATMSSAEASQPPKERYEVKRRRAGHGRRHIVNLDDQLTEQFDVRAARFANAWNPLRTHEDW